MLRSDFYAASHTAIQNQLGFAKDLVGPGTVQVPFGVPGSVLAPFGLRSGSTPVSVHFHFIEESSSALSIEFLIVIASLRGQPEQGRFPQKT